MLFSQRIPILIKWLLSVYLFFLLSMSLFRFAFFLKYATPGNPFSGSAFLMGLRFDIKFISILILAILLLCAIPFLNPFKKKGAAYFWNIILPVVYLGLLVFYIADYFHYDYLRQRLNANVLSYTEDAAISANMVKESYPVFSVVVITIIGMFLAVFIFKKILKRYMQATPVIVKRKFIWNFFFFVLLGLSVFGKIGQFPLRWSDAFTLSNDFKANVALNPFQSFFSTIRFADIKPDKSKVSEYYKLMADYLGVQNQDIENLNFERNYSFTDSIKKQQPNVVLVICESFSMYKSNMSGNPLNTTPFFNQMCENGIFFEKCFTPAYGTARGVWATVTAIPDVLGTSKQTASRNPSAVNQHTIINDFKGYDRFYFLGGNPTWANIQGILKNNIDSLQLFSQDDYKAEKVDVWGISDKHLLLEANGILAKGKKPFFAIIQTADNHRPYTIPEEDLVKFKKVSHPNDTLKKYGFGSNEELNAFRYTDFCFQQFIEAAKKESYFANTIFVFVGDHGIRGDVADVYPKAWTEQGLSAEHVPLLFYSPALVQPKKYSMVCSQIDILPSIASLVKMPYRNNSLGRNLFDSSYQNKSFAFIIDHDERSIGMMNNEYFFIQNLHSKKQEFVSIVNNEKILATPYTDSIKKHLTDLSTAFYHTSKYLIYNNKKK